VLPHSSPPSARSSLHLQLLVSSSSNPNPTEFITGFAATPPHHVTTNGRSHVIGILPSWWVSSDKMGKPGLRQGGELVDVGLAFFLLRLVMADESTADVESKIGFGLVQQQVRSHIRRDDIFGLVVCPLGDLATDY